MYAKIQLDMSESLKKLVQRDAQSHYLPHYGLFTAMYGVLAIVGIVYLSLTRPSGFEVIAITSMLAVLQLFFFKAEYGILALIVARPIIDTFAGYTVLTIRSFSVNMNAVLGIAVIAWGLFIILRDRIDLRKVPGMIWIVLLLAASTASIAVSIDVAISITELLRMSSLFLFYIIGWHLTQQDNHFIVWVVNAIAISAIAPIVVSLYQLITISGLSYGGLSNRLYGTFGHPNVLGFYMVLVIAIVLSKYLSAPFRHRSLLYPWILAGAGFALLFTYTRGAWLGLAAFLIVLGIMKYRKPFIMVIIAISLLIVSAQGINQLSVSLFNYDLNEVPLVNRFTSRSEEGDSITWRLEVVQEMVPKTLQQPALGYGIGNFVTLRERGDIGLFEDPEAHNDYLRLAVEIGYVGLAMYIGWILALSKNAWFKLATFHKNSWQRNYAIAALGLIAAFYLMSAGDNILQGTPVMWSFMLAMGSLLGIRGLKLASRN